MNTVVVGVPETATAAEARQQTQSLVVIGQGYVGLPMAMRAVNQGFQVLGVDLDQSKVEQLNDAVSYIDDVTDADLARALSSGRYRATTDLALAIGFDIAVVTVPTPLLEGQPDLSYIESAARAIAPYVTVGCTVILESTTYPGTTEELFAPLLSAGSGLRAGDDFHVGYSPERIDPGNQTWRFENTPKVVSGVDGPSLAAIKAFYDTIVETTVPVSSPAVAEMTKLLENTFRHVNIALINELAMFAHDLDIPIQEVVDAASTKPFGYMKFSPGPGVGGHCLPIDPSYLSWQVKRRLGRTFRFVELANTVNEHMPEYIVHRVIDALNNSFRAVRGSRVLVLGVAYKPNTSDFRESPSLKVAEMLAMKGANVRVVDDYVSPLALGSRVNLVGLNEAEIVAADLVLVLTDHDNIDYELVARHARAALDLRHRLVGEKVERM